MADVKTLTISARGKPTFLKMDEWFSHFNRSGYNNITGVFGFTKERSPLYGGRIWGQSSPNVGPDGAEITDEDYVWMLANGIKLKILLSGDKVSKQHYEESLPLLEKYHTKGNSVVMVNDKLAEWVRRDYSDYTIEASVIKQTQFSEIEKVLDIYDRLHLPMHLNDDEEELKKIKQKDRIVLFANAKCAYGCRSQICYATIATANRTGDASVYRCSQMFGLTKPPSGMKVFDMEKLNNLGFFNFKVSGSLYQTELADNKRRWWNGIISSLRSDNHQK
jgi:hypothetical protein